jgi:hypothetical protein
MPVQLKKSPHPPSAWSIPPGARSHFPIMLDCHVVRMKPIRGPIRVWSHQRDIFYRLKLELVMRQQSFRCPFLSADMSSQKSYHGIQRNPPGHAQVQPPTDMQGKKNRHKLCYPARDTAYSVLRSKRNMWCAISRPSQTAFKCRT